MTRALGASSLPRLLLNPLATRSVVMNTVNHTPFLVLAAAGVLENVDRTHIGSGWRGRIAEDAEADIAN